MTVGEFEFDDIFIETIGKNTTETRRPLNPFPVAGFIFLCFFLLLMTIVLMNLLVSGCNFAQALISLLIVSKTKCSNLADS